MVMRLVRDDVLTEEIDEKKNELRKAAREGEQEDGPPSTRGGPGRQRPVFVDYQSKYAVRAPSVSAANATTTPR